MSTLEVGFDSSVVELANLNGGDLSALARRDLLALRLPNFVDEHVCDHIMERIGGLSTKSAYAVAPDIEKAIGGAIFDAAGDPDALVEYYELAASRLTQCRQAFLPFPNPADTLRVNLQELWPYGCQMERFHDKLMFAGLLRGFREGAEARPHQDCSHWDVPESKGAHELLTQLSAVIYFATAEEGGELELWDHSISIEASYNRAKVPGDYGIDRAIIGPPAATLKPRRRELIIFDARRIHAVTKIKKGLRYSQSLFIGYRGSNTYLSTYS